MARAVAVIGLTVLLAGCIQLSPAGSPLPGSSETPGGPLPSGAAVVSQPPNADATKKPRRPRRSPTPPAATTPTDTSAPTPTTAPTDTSPADRWRHSGGNDIRPSGNIRPLPPIDNLPSFILEPIDDPELDYTLTPNYGTASLGAGFTPDPYSVGMTSGGHVDVSYLGSSCAGFATQAPDLRVNVSGGGALLRLYFIAASADTTMVVNDPFGNFYCVDDSFATVNPTIDFNNPANGAYDIWVGSYASGTLVPGTFYVTANSGNHP